MSFVLGSLANLQSASYVWIDLLVSGVSMKYRIATSQLVKALLLMV